MSRIRIGALAALVACAAAFGATGTASAADTPAFTKQMAITGKNKGKDFKGTYTVKRFTSSGGKVFAVGTLKGTLKNRKVSRSNVRIPAAVSKPAAASQLPPNPTPGACQVLDLTLQPIDLNLLGLLVATSRIEALIEAIPGQNALLGNLLCAVTGLLDPQGTSTGTLSSVLNSLLALVPRTA
jgi:hypothetical protein